MPKRQSEKQLTLENYNEEDESDVGGEIKGIPRARVDELKVRPMMRARRRRLEGDGARPSSETTGTGIFGSFTFGFPSASSTPAVSTSDNKPLATPYLPPPITSSPYLPPPITSSPYLPPPITSSPYPPGPSVTSSSHLPPKTGPAISTSSYLPQHIASTSSYLPGPSLTSSSYPPGPSLTSSSYPPGPSVTSSSSYLPPNPGKAVVNHPPTSTSPTNGNLNIISEEAADRVDSLHQGGGGGDMRGFVDELKRMNEQILASMKNVLSQTSACDLSPLCVNYLQLHADLARRHQVTLPLSVTNSLTSLSRANPLQKPAHTSCSDLDSNPRERLRRGFGFLGSVSEVVKRTRLSDDREGDDLARSGKRSRAHEAATRSIPPAPTHEPTPPVVDKTPPLAATPSLAINSTPATASPNFGVLSSAATWKPETSCPPTTVSPSQPAMMASKIVTTSAIDTFKFGVPSAATITKVPQFVRDDSTSSAKPSPFTFGSSTDPTNKPGVFKFGSGDSKSAVTTPGFTFGQALAPPAARLGFLAPPPPAVASVSPSDLPTPAFTFGTTSLTAPPTTGDKPAAAGTNNVGSADGGEEYVPPKVEVNRVVEEDSKFSTRCKLFYQKDGEYKDKGIGMLYVKCSGDDAAKKLQLLIRADTNLGNILLNIAIVKDMSISQVGKNNVLIVCSPNPPIPDMKEAAHAVPMLIKLKTEAQSKQLLDTLTQTLADLDGGESGNESGDDDNDDDDEEDVVVLD